MSSEARVPRDRTSFVLDPAAVPVLTVEPGARVVFETLDCFSGRLTSPEQRFDSDAELMEHVGGSYNPVTGPVYVEGAQPGDHLAVTIESIALGTAWPYAVTASTPADARFLDLPVEGYPDRGVTRICPLDGDVVVFATTRGELRLPVLPMVGTIGTAPATSTPSLAYGARHGGNLDCPFATTGATVYLPVAVAGGLLALGDVHALMGDAELTGTALETNADVAVTIELMRGPPLGSVRLDDPGRIGAIGCGAGANLGENVASASAALHDRLVTDHGLSPAEAFDLLGATAGVQVNQCVAGGWQSAYVYIDRMLVEQLNRP